MKWIKRLLVLLAGTLLGSVLIVAGVVLFFGESNYKSLLGWGAERFLNSQLIIEGPLKVDISRDLSLTSGDILLLANDDSYRLAIGKLHANFRLGSYLRTRTFWFNNLELQDIKLEVKETAESDDFSFEDFKIPSVVIDQAQLNNLEINYQELFPGTLHTFLLDELTIGELGEHQPLSLSAKGLFEGQPFVIQGTSDSIAQIFERQDPLTLQLDLSSELINAKLKGSIAEPLNGRGLDLQIQVDIPQVRDIIEIVWDEIPALGSLQGSLNVRGDYTATRLEEIDLHIQRGKEVDLIVKGSVLDVRSGTGLDLQLEGQSSNPQVLSWLLFKKHDRMQAVQVSGTLRRDAMQFSLHDLNATAKTADGVKLQVDGSTVVHPQGHRLTQADAGLAVNFSAPTLAADNLFEIDEISELGPVSGSFELALGMDALAIYSADVDIGVGATGQPTIRTDFKLTTQLHKGSTINAKFDMAVAQLIAAFSDLQPKNLGRLQGDAVISDVDGEWGFESFNLASTQTSLYQVKLNGSYGDLMNYDQASIDSSLVIDSPVKLGKALGVDLSGFGILASTGQLTIKKGHLQFDGKASLGRTKSTAKFSGYLEDSKPVLEGSFNIPVLYLADFGMGSEVAPVSPVSGETKHERPYIFSRDEIDVNFLNKFDLDFVVSIDEVKSGAFAIDNIRGNIKLNDGHLAGPHRLVHKGRNIDFNLEIKALAKPEYLLSLSADDLALGQLMAQVTKEIPLEGYSHINFDLTTRGNTPHEMASNLSGDLDFELENLQIPKKYVELLYADVLGWALSKSVEKKSHHNLNCSVFKFVVNAGEVKSKSIIADGSNLSLAGKIDMNLGKETLDIVLIPKEKKRLFDSSTPVKIHGPMKKPKVDAIPAKAAIAEIGTMALLPGVFIPLRAGEKLWSLLKGGDKVGGGCAKIDELTEAAKNKASVRKEK